MTRETAAARDQYARDIYADADAEVYPSAATVRACLLLAGGAVPAREQEELHARQADLPAEDRIAILPDPSACTHNPGFKVPDHRGTATYTALAMKVVSDYVATLEAMAGSKAPGSISANAQGFVKAVNAFKAARGEPEAISADQIAPLGGVVGALAEARRARMMRRFVDEAHEPLRDVLRELIAYSERNLDRLDREVSRLDKAHVAMLEAKSRGGEAYVRSVAAYDAALTRFRSRYAKSNSARLAAIWTYHNILRESLGHDPDPEEIIKLLEDIKALS